MGCGDPVKGALVPGSICPDTERLVEEKKTHSMGFVSEFSPWESGNNGYWAGGQGLW